MAIIAERISGGIGIIGGQTKKSNPLSNLPGLYKVSGFHFDELGSLTKWQGFSKYNLTVLQDGSPLANAEFTGLFDFTLASQVKNSMATTKNGIYKYGDPTANIYNLLTLPGITGSSFSIVTNDHVDFAVLNDILYITNRTTGALYNFFWTGSGSVQTMGIDKPATGPTVAVGAAGVLSGVYSYKVTFYNPNQGFESNSSPVSNDVTVTNQQINLSVIPTSTNPQVTRRRLYRTTTGGGVWLFLAEIADNTTTTYVDNAGDATLGIAIEEFAHGIPKPAIMFELYRGFLFYVQNNSSRLFFTKNNNPTAQHANDFRDLDPSDNDVITGIKGLQDILIAYKNDSIWNGGGDTREDIEFIKQISGIGSVNHKSILKIPGKNIHMFLSENGFYGYNGINEDYMSADIEPDIRGLNQARLKYSYGFIYKPKNIAAWLISNGASAQHDLIIIYDYVQNKWAIRPITNTKANIATIIEDAQNNEIFYIGGHDGFVRQGDIGLSDDGSAISCEVIDKPRPLTDVMNKAEEDSAKMFYEVDVFFKPQASVILTVSYILDVPSDNAADYTTIGTIDTTSASGRARLTFNAIGRRIYIRITNAAISAPVTLRGWQVRYKTIGRVS